MRTPTQPTDLVETTTYAGVIDFDIDPDDETEDDEELLETTTTTTLGLVVSVPWGAFTGLAVDLSDDDLSDDDRNSPGGGCRSRRATMRSLQHGSEENAAPPEPDKTSARPAADTRPSAPACAVADAAAPPPSEPWRAAFPLLFSLHQSLAEFATATELRAPPPMTYEQVMDHSRVRLMRRIQSRRSKSLAPPRVPFESDPVLQRPTADAAAIRGAS